MKLGTTCQETKPISSPEKLGEVIGFEPMVCSNERDYRRTFGKKDLGMIEEIELKSTTQLGAHTGKRRPYLDNIVAQLKDNRVLEALVFDKEVHVPMSSCITVNPVDIAFQGATHVLFEVS